MHSFLDERPERPGARWTAQLTLGTEALDLGDAYANAAQQWWQAYGDSRDWEEVMSVVKRPLRHITLFSLNRPAEEITPAQIDDLTRRITHGLAGCPPVSVLVGPVVVNTVALEVYIAPNPMLTEIRQVVYDAYQDVFGPIPETKRWRAHTAFAYCHAAFDDTGLTGALHRTPGPVAGYLAPVATTVSEVVLAATDAWAPDGFTWDEGTARKITLSSQNELGSPGPRNGGTSG